jgi:hypothetical protein
MIDMIQDDGVSVPDRATAVEPEVSALRDGIANAEGRSAEQHLADLLATPFPPVYDPDDTLGAMLDNQAWIVLSHVASRIGQRDGYPDLMEEWQAAWADGKVQEGYFSPHRGVAAWIARHCQLIPAKAIEARSDKTGTGLAEGESAAPQGFAQTQSGAD